MTETNNKIILTIGRQFGSGGRIIGKKIAEALNIAYYDKALLSLAAKESGLSENVFAKADEHTAGSMAYAFSMGYNLMGVYTPYSNILSNDGLFKLQSDTIRNLAEKEPCVIVGRCADYILREHPSLISFFIHDNVENRIQRIIGYENCTVEAAKELMIKTDKSRSAYYNFYTNKTWGASSSYNFSLDLSVLGVDESVELIKELVSRKLKHG